MDRKSLRRLSERMLESTFRKSGRNGFNLESVRDNCISGKFIEKVTFDEIITDPFGTEIVIKRVRFDSTEFFIYSDSALIECVNPARNFKNLLNEIAKLMNYEVTITKLLISLHDLLSQLSKNAQSVVVSKAVAEDIEIGDGAFAQLHAAGPADIRKPLQLFVGKRKLAFNRIRVIVKWTDEDIIVEATKSGSVSSTTEISPKQREFLRGNIGEICQPEKNTN